MTSPHLTLDVTPLLEADWTGIPVFTRRLAQALRRHGGIELDFMTRLVRVPEAAVRAAIAANTGVYLRAGIEGPGAFAGELADRTGAFLYPSVKESFSVARREASTVHDMSTLFMPECHEVANVAYHLDHLARQLDSDEVVFCISEATRAALLAAFPSAADKVVLLEQYVDWPDDFPLLEDNLPRLRLGRYAVVVGTLEPRKNLSLLLRALSTRPLQRSPLRFVVIGRRGWKVERFFAELPAEARERVLFSGFVSEFTKYRLMRGADFLIFPSIYEGFGIPALEAMSLGKPVLASRSSSLPDLVGEAGVYFDPLSVDEFSQALATIEHPRKLAELAPLALAASARFDWRRMAEPVVAWLRDAGQGARGGR